MKSIYLIKAGETDLYKIGLSKNVNSRIKGLQTGNGNQLLIIDIFQTNFNKLFETTLHRHFQLNKTQGEWFLLENFKKEEFQKVCNKLENNLKYLKESGNYFIK